MPVLDGKAAIVTGSARGIGRATAELLAQQGARVLINDLDADLAAQTAAEIEGATAVFAGDLTVDGVPEALVQKAVAEFGQLDIVVNNAGYSWDGMAHKMSDEQFRAMLEIHTVVPFKVLRAAAPYLRDAGKADKEAGREIFRKVVNVTSISGTQGNLGQANYSAAKAGLVGLTKTLAREWGAFKVNVNAVAFGFVETRMTASSDDGSETFKKGEIEIPLGIPERMRQLAPTVIPLGRPATPAGRSRTDLLPLHAVVELRPRPGDHGERRPDDRDDVMSFDLDAIGCPGEDRWYEVAEETLLAYADATDDVPGRARLRDRARLGGDRAGVALGRLGRGAEAGRPLRAGHDAAPPDRSRHEARLARDAGRVARPAERNVARDQDRDPHRRRRARERAVRDRVLSRSRSRRRAAASAHPTHRLEPEGDPIAEVAYPVAEDQTSRYAAASGDDFAIHLDDEFARKVGLPGRIVHGFCTMAFAGRAVVEAAGARAAGRQAPRRPLLGAALPRRDCDDPSVARERRLRLRVRERRGQAGDQGRAGGAAVSIDLENVVAIDIHTHAEVGETGEDGLRPEWRDAAKKYFGEGRDCRPSRTWRRTTGSGRWWRSSSPSMRRPSLGDPPSATRRSPTWPPRTPTS